MGGWRNPRDLAPPCALIVNPRLAGLLARRLLSRLERDRTHIREEHFLVCAREDLDGLFQRHPFHRLDIVHRLAPGPPIARICQNCTILIRPSTEYNIEPRNPWTETSCPVSSNTSRLAAASAGSPG